MVLVIRFSHSPQQRQARILGVVENGTQAIGQVSEATSGTVTINNSPLVSLTLWYDQNDPGNQKKIAIAAEDISTATVEEAIGEKDAATDLS